MRFPFAPFSFLRSASEASSAQPTGGGESPSGTGARVDPVQVLLGLVGFGISLYALTLHLQVKRGGESLTCDVNDVISCSSVLGSKYGEFLSIPLGALGMSYFGIVLAAAIFPKLTTVSRSWMARLRVLVGAVGAAVSLSLVYITYAKIGAVCPVCVSTHIVVSLNFLWSLAQFLRVRKVSGEAHSPAAFSRFVAVSLGFAGPPLLVGVLAPSFVNLLPAPKSAAAVPPPAASALPGATAKPALELSVARSAYVGAGEDYRQGSDSARVVLQMFSDFQCGYCAITADAIDQALSAVGRDRVLFVYRNYPLSNKCNPSVSSEGHPFACQLAHGARCAGQQGKFWEFKSWAFSTQKMSESERAEAASDAGLAKQAQALGLNVDSFKACTTAKAEMPKIADDVKVGNQLGITGTPTLFINGTRYEGEMRPENLQAALLSALAK